MASDRDPFFDDPIARRLADVAHRDVHASRILHLWRAGHCSRDEALIWLVEALAAERARLMEALTRRALFESPVILVRDAAASPCAGGTDDE